MATKKSARGAAKSASKKSPAKKATARPATRPAGTGDWVSDPAAFAPVLASAKDAFGLRAMRPGFSFSSSQDALFALGWPHMCALVDGHPDDADPAESTRRIVETLDPPYFEPAYRGAWPREVAYRFMRSLGVPHFRRAGSSTAITSEALARFAMAGPPTRADIAATFHFVFTSGHMLARWMTPSMVLLAEAIVGSEPAADALMSALEKLTADHWSSSVPQVAESAYQLGFLMLRMKEAARRETTARARKILERARAADPTCYGAMMLDCVVGGAEAAERSGNLTLSRFGHVLDNGRVIVDVEKQKIGEFFPDARLAFLAGPELLDLWAKRWRELKSADKQRAFLWQLHWIRSEKATAIVKELASTSKVRTEASAWLASHA
jgi:hypothetical protein